MFNFVLNNRSYYSAIRISTGRTSYFRKSNFKSDSLIDWVVHVLNDEGESDDTFTIVMKSVTFIVGFLQLQSHYKNHQREISCKRNQLAFDCFMRIRIKWVTLLETSSQIFFQRFNVAITRAQALLILIGNPDMLCMDTNWTRLAIDFSFNPRWISYLFDTILRMRCGWLIHLATAKIAQQFIFIF